MANIKFAYVYRCGGNYKNYKEVVFDNPDNVDVVELEVLIGSKLYDGMWFYVDQWLLPDMHFGTWDNELDHTWHEFESVTFTEESADFSVSLCDFIARIKLMEK